MSYALYFVRWPKENVSYSKNIHTGTSLKHPGTKGSCAVSIQNSVRNYGFDTKLRTELRFLYKTPYGISVSIQNSVRNYVKDINCCVRNKNYMLAKRRNAGLWKFRITNIIPGQLRPDGEIAYLLYGRDWLSLRDWGHPATARAPDLRCRRQRWI